MFRRLDIHELPDGGPAAHDADKQTGKSEHCNHGVEQLLEGNKSKLCDFQTFSILYSLELGGGILCTGHETGVMLML